MKFVGDGYSKIFLDRFQLSTNHFDRGGRDRELDLSYVSPIVLYI